MINPLDLAFSSISDYLSQVDTAPVFPTPENVEELKIFEEDLPNTSSEGGSIIRLMDNKGAPATVASTGGRYFGFVTGGSMPPVLSASLISTTWDQNGALEVMSPVGARLESVASNWLLAALHLPSGAGVGFVTGATVANFVALAAARHALLKNQGWDVESKGLFGAPVLQVVVGEEVHISLLKALGMLGLGRDRVVKVPTDRQGRMRADALPKVDDKTIVCLQAGNVNTGALDPALMIAQQIEGSGAWVHVDGAFGLWARASANKKHLAIGYDLADSWATDAHKWLNVPYDSGLVICKNPAHLKGAMSATSASYLMPGQQSNGCDHTPEMSRKARGIEVWAALKHLGRSGLAELIDRNCRFAVQFAEGLANAGYEVLNDVVLNQVLVKFGNADTTLKVVKAIQDDGTCWCGSTVWQGHTAMRISVSSWRTTQDDVEKSLAAMIRIAQQYS